jgi:hypothetical protein
MCEQAITIETVRASIKHWEAKLDAISLTECAIFTDPGATLLSQNCMDTIDSLKRQLERLERKKADSCFYTPRGNEADDAFMKDGTVDGYLTESAKKQIRAIVLDVVHSDNHDGPEVLRTCATSGSNQASVTINFPNAEVAPGVTGLSVGNVSSEGLRDAIAMCVKDAMNFSSEHTNTYDGIKEEQLQLREITFLSVGGRVIIDNFEYRG